MPQNARINDMTGQIFGRLVVVKIHCRNNGIHWLCKCECGGQTIVKTGHLNSGGTRSCGCLKSECCRKASKISAKKRSLPFKNKRKLKDLRRNIINRCTNPKDKRWANYGGRGISICQEWIDNPILFYQWAIDNSYKPGLQIDRIDVHGNYEPNNCRFVDIITQMNNTTKNRNITWNGKTQTVSEWAREIGIRPQALIHRFTRKWSLKRAMTQPYRERIKNK